jgi:hypothetical protein
MNKHQGSCLFGKVICESNGEITDVLNCHCPMCRKAHGAAFRTRGTVLSKDFQWVTGEEHVKFYNSSPGHYRSFCKNCGSTLISRLDAEPNVFGFPLGILDPDPQIRAACHVFVKYKAPWHDISDDLPQFEEGIDTRNRNQPKWNVQ